MFRCCRQRRLATTETVPLRGRAVFLVLATLLLGACDTTRSSHSLPSPDCTPDASFPPRCGALWGVTPTSATVEALASVESAVGRRFDVVYRFHGMTGDVIDDYDRHVVRGGRLLHLSIDSADLLGGGQPPWAAIAAGTYDDLLVHQAREIAALHAPVLVTFDHEANNASKSVLGTPGDFRSMWRHVHDVYDQAGADNVVWVWVMMGDAQTLDVAGTMWPGNDVVDWISWDVYNPAGCHGFAVKPELSKSFEAAMLPFYTWVMAHGESVGMDTSKPMMISEAGSAIPPGHSDVAAQWYAEIPAVLQQYPQVKAVGLWDHTGTTSLCDYTFEHDPVVLAEVAKAGHEPWVSGRVHE